MQREDDIHSAHPASAYGQQQPMRDEKGYLEGEQDVKGDYRDDSVQVQALTEMEEVGAKK